MNLIKDIYFKMLRGGRGMEQTNHEMQVNTSTEVCSNCGTVLGMEQMFCPKCGTPKGKEVQQLICGKCGAELEEGQEFCPKCGQKVGLVVDDDVVSAINQFNSGVEMANAKKKKTPIVIAVVLIIGVLGALAFKTVAPKIFISVEGYMEQGNYEKAYEKAKTDDEKLEVIAENVAAVQSAVSVDSLKDPSSFSLRDAYYNEGENDDGDVTKQLVLYITGANSYGANVSSYWLYTWNIEDKEWEYFCSVSDLSDEEYSKYDDDDERVEKLVNNIGRSSIESTMKKGTKLSKDGVKRINAMFENDTLEDVELIDVE